MNAEALTNSSPALTRVARELWVMT